MKKEDIQAALEAISKSGITVNGDLVLEKKVDYEVANVENGGIGIQIINGRGELRIHSKPGDAKDKIEPVEKKLKPRETMTFKKKNSVLDGHITLLFNNLTKEGWIEGNEADFKALFSGRQDEDCVITWLDKYGKAALFALFNAFEKEGLIIVPDGFGISTILEGHFKDKSGQWLSGLDKGNKAHKAAMPVIVECVKMLKSDYQRLINGDDQDDEDFQSVYDPHDHQDLNLHRR